MHFKKNKTKPQTQRCVVPFAADERRDLLVARSQGGPTFIAISCLLVPFYQENVRKNPQKRLSQSGVSGATLHSPQIPKADGRPRENKKSKKKWDGNRSHHLQERLQTSHLQTDPCSTLSTSMSRQPTRKSRQWQRFTHGSHLLFYDLFWGFNCLFVSALVWHSHLPPEDVI